MDINKKFLFINPATSNEDNARTFPVSSLRAFHMTDADDMKISFDDAGTNDHTVAAVKITDNLSKTVMREFVEAINFSKDAVVVLANQANDSSVSANIDFAGGITFTEGVSVASFSGNITSTAGTLVISDGGAVTQLTSRTTAVTSNTHTGKITTDNAAIADDAVVTFTVNCNDVAATDLVILNHVDGGTAGHIEYAITDVNASSFKITYKNVSGASSTSQFVFRYAIISAPNS